MIRTLTELQEEMSAEFAWRKKELHQLKSMVVANENTPHRDLFIRAAITLLYAHWEGFIKRIGTAYLEFVANRRLTNDELSAPFLALSVGRLVRAVAAANTFQPCLDLVAFFRSKAASQCKINWKTGINTKANLKSSVFQEIVASLGLDYSRFATKEKLIDEKLLKNRNSIAHGRYSLVGFEEYLELHDEMYGIMQDFYNQIENSAFLGSYRKPAPTVHGNQ